MSESWLESKNKSRKNVTIVIISTVIVSFIGLIVFNNIETATQSAPKHSSSEQKPQEAVAAHRADSATSVKIKETAHKQDSLLWINSNKSTIQSRDSAYTVEVENISCAVADAQGLALKISLILYCNTPESEKEVLFKRDDIKVMVKKVFRDKRLSDINVDMLRAQLIQEIDNVVEQGKIKDIEFLDFQPLAK